MYKMYVNFILSIRYFDLNQAFNLTFESNCTTVSVRYIFCHLKKHIASIIKTKKTSEFLDAVQSTHTFPCQIVWSVCIQMIYDH